MTAAMTQVSVPATICRSVSPCALRHVVHVIVIAGDIVHVAAAAAYQQARLVIQWDHLHHGLLIYLFLIHISMLFLRLLNHDFELRSLNHDLFAVMDIDAGP